MALRGIQEYIAGAMTILYTSRRRVQYCHSECNIFLYPPKKKTSNIINIIYIRLRTWSKQHHFDSPDSRFSNSILLWFFFYSNAIGNLECAILWAISLCVFIYNSMLCVMQWKCANHVNLTYLTWWALHQSPHVTRVQVLKCPDEAILKQ